MVRRAEANDTLDMFDDPTASNNSINQTLQNNTSSVREEAINQMRAAIANNANLATRNTTITRPGQAPTAQPQPQAQPIPQPQPITQTQPPVTTQQAPIPSPMPVPPALPDNPVANEANQATTQAKAQPATPTPPAQEIIAENPLNDDAVKTNDAIIKPDSVIAEIEAEQAEAKRKAEAERQERIKETEENTDPVILDLANNKDFSVETIAKQAKRIKEKKDDEVYISLH